MRLSAAAALATCGLLLSGCASESSHHQHGALKPSGRTQPGRVSRVVSRSATTLIELTTRGGVITTTTEHPFAKLGSGWTRADRLVAGDRIETSRGDPVSILQVRRIEGRPTAVFNLVVEGSHSYYVGDDELLVHNVNCGLGILRNWRRPASGPSDATPPDRLTLRDLMDLEAYRDGTKLRPPPGSPERRRLDQLEELAARSRKPEEKPAQDPRERAKRWAREHPFPGQWAERSEQGALDTPPTLRELMDLEAYRDGTKLRPPPGTPARRRLDEIESRVESWERSQSAQSSPEKPADPREKARRWARDVPWPGRPAKP